jgi:hypothetical protein
MPFDRDIHPRRIKNRSSEKPNFAVQAHSIYLIFGLFERVCQDAVQYRAFFLNSYFLSGEKG